jgi:hypothetical protein
MKVYLLYYDTDYGDREEWNTFHTPCEVFDSAEKRQARIDFIKSQVDQDGEPVEYEFHEVDLDIMSDAEIQKWSE